MPTPVTMVFIWEYLGFGEYPKDDQSFSSRDQGTIYRQDRKWGPDLVSQVLRALLTTKFIGTNKLIKEIVNSCSG